MAAGQLDLVIEQGATFTKDLIWSAGKPAVPVDLTGCKGLIQFREKLGSPVVFELTTENNRIVFGPAPGAIHLEIDDRSTGAMTKGGVYDMLVFDATDRAHRLVQGAYEVALGSSKRA